MANPFTSGPIALYRNLPIESQYYSPGVFDIIDIRLGSSTQVATAEPTNYVIGQQVRLVIPSGFGCQQLNGKNGYVIGFNSLLNEKIPIINQIYPGPSSLTYSVNILSPFLDDYPSGTVMPTTLKAQFTSGATPTFFVSIGDDGAGNLYAYAGQVSNFISGTINYNSGALSAIFSRGVGNPVPMDFTIQSATLVNETIVDIDSSKNVDPFVENEYLTTQPTILAIGDINSGQINSNGPAYTKTFIPGSFINISPN